MLEKSIRETDITCRDMLIVSTFPVPVIFSVSPTYNTHALHTQNTPVKYRTHLECYSKNVIHTYNTHALHTKNTLVKRHTYL